MISLRCVCAATVLLNTNVWFGGTKINSQTTSFVEICRLWRTRVCQMGMGMGWDRLWVWCRHRSNDCSLAHRLPTQAFRPSGWQGYSREKSPPRPKPEQPDDSTIFRFWQGSSPSQHSFTSSGCLSSEKAENVDLGRQEKGFASGSSTLLRIPGKCCGRRRTSVTTGWK